MSEARYYTPKIEEFHVGFEYECKLNDGSWVKNVFPKLSEPNFEEFSISEGNVRVKFLDKKDIEAEGWHWYDGKFKIFKSESDIYTMFPLEFPWFSIHSTLLSRCVFHGKINNSSKLRDVMEMITN